MKVDGKEIAKANLAKRASNEKMGAEAGPAVQEEILDTGAHINHMASMIEAVHSKDPQAAHKHMLAYAQSMAKE